MARGELEGIVEDLVNEYDEQCSARGLSDKDRLRVARMVSARFEDIQSAVEDRIDGDLEDDDDWDDEEDEDADYGELDFLEED